MAHTLPSHDAVTLTAHLRRVLLAHPSLQSVECQNHVSSMEVRPDIDDHTGKQLCEKGMLLYIVIQGACLDPKIGNTLPEVGNVTVTLANPRARVEVEFADATIVEVEFNV